MSEQEKKRQITKISVFITSIFVIFLSISYAFINQTLTGTKRQVITSGNLKLELKEKDAITLSNALPMYDEVGLTQEPFTFSLENGTTTPTNYVLSLVDITPSDKEKLSANFVRYSLEKNGNRSIDYIANVMDKNGVLEQGQINGNEIIHYSLRMWIDSYVEDENEIKDKTLSYKLKLEASQEIEISYKGMMKAREFSQWDWHSYDLTYNDYYQYHNNITNIVIENKINVPNTIEENKKWDMSELQDGSVMAYLEEDGTLESGEVAYKLHIQGNGGVIANADCAALFNDFPELLSITGFEHLDVSNVKLFRISDPASSAVYSIFANCPKLKLDLSKLDTSKVTDMSFMFYNYSDTASLDLSNFDTSNATNMSYMFYNYSGTAPLDLGNFDTSKVTDMSGMFSDYSSTASLDLSSFDTSKVTDMSGMFSNYSSTASLDLGNFDTSKVTDMSSMFYDYSSAAPLNLSNFNTSNVIDMNNMFHNYSSTASLDLSSFNTSKVTNMHYMFYHYSSTAPLDLSHFNTSNVTNMSEMFHGYSSPSALDLSSFDTSKVTDMSWMFMSYQSTSALDLSNFDTSNVENMSRMFYDYSSTATLDISSFDFSKVTQDIYIFDRDSEYYGSPILVKDESTKAWVLSKNSSLTGVTIKGS